MRTLGLLVLVPLAAFWMARKESAQATEGPRNLRREALPLFVIAFLGLVVLRTLGDSFTGDSSELLPKWQQLLALGQTASDWLLLCGIGAVGLGVTFSHLREAGWRPILLSFVAALLTGACGLALSYSLQ